MVSKLVSEFIGVFMLVLTVGSACAPIPNIFSVLSIGVSLMCMIYSLGNVSGAHFNPAVTTAVVLSGRGKCSVSDGAAYAGVQVLAGIMAGCIYSHFHAVGPRTSEAVGLKLTDWAGAAAAEIFFTFVLAFVVLSVATAAGPTSKTKQNFYFALAIGSCVSALLRQVCRFSSYTSQTSRKHVLCRFVGFCWMV